MSDVPALMSRRMTGGEAIGAVNFPLKTPGGKLRRYNTDGEGYAVSLEQVMPTLRGVGIPILGTGGTEASIALALRERGARLTIVNPNIN
jgi:shikimate 5-dehydrogenase